jgi:hypothetical protein
MWGRGDDQVRGFCEDLERNGGLEDWQVRQADQALRIYFVNFLKRTEWNRRPASAVIDEQGCTNRLAALDELRTRVSLMTSSGRLRSHLTRVAPDGAAPPVTALLQRAPSPRTQQ